MVKGLLLIRSAAHCQQQLSVLKKSLNTMASLSGIDQGKKAAAYEAVDQHVKSDMAVGGGSGSTIVFAVDRLAELTKNGTLTNVKYVPTSHQVKYFFSEKRNSKGCV